MKILNNMYKFTDTDADITNSKVYKCMQAAQDGNIKEFKKIYKELCKSSFQADTLQQGYYKLMGYQFNFRPYLKKFLVAFRYNNNNYSVIYAINKSNIYDNFYISRYNVIDILEDNR